MTEPKEDFRVDLADGKYTYIRYSDGNQKVLRHGTEWGRDITGDGLIAAMGYEIEELREEVEKLRAAMQTVQQAHTEMYSAFMNPTWFTKGRSAADQHFLLWSRKLKEAVDAVTQKVCGACNGTGRMVRDPDIGTDQECFACDGSGKQEE